MDYGLDYGVGLRELHNVNRTVWDYHYSNRLHLYGFSIMPTLLRPKSRGSVTLKSAGTQFSAVARFM